MQAVKTTFPRIFALSLMTLVGVGGATSLVLAHSGATGVTKDRMDLMQDMADAMKIMGAMFKGETPFAPAIVAEKANLLADHAKTIPDMTPEGSNNHPSEALPIIWQDWGDYVQSAEGLAEASAELVVIANDGADETEARVQYVKLGKACGTCHDRFRTPKE
ncbi:MAG: c-type cytochrome [Geminicoccaceae bacterium]